jgi:alkylhydroperoxidase/carboxymuconolactone decarboxylase family protein YurZ
VPRRLIEQRQSAIDEHPEMWKGFVAMRKAIQADGPMDMKTIEVLTMVSYATVGAEGGTRTQAVAAHKAGASPAELRQAILLGLGVGMGFSAVYQALEWVREALEEAGVTE